jgi:NAD+ kinase
LTIASTTGSDTQLAKPLSRVAVITHGKAQTIGPALARLESVARDAGVELLLPEEELEKHGASGGDGVDLGGAELAVVLGGDGTMLRALGRFLDAGVPVIGVNFGRVGFLASIRQERLEADLARVFAGEYQVVELPTLDAEIDGGTRVAVNDVVITSSILGRMVELGWAVGNEDLGRQPCDGVICSTPSGSTAYNLSNGGPVLVWGLDAMAVTFVAPHSLHARPLVIPRSRDVIIWNRTADVPVTVLIDGHVFAEVQPAGRVVVRLGPKRSRLATLPETTFFTRYRETFGS